jgi:hypothetical protein
MQWQKTKNIPLINFINKPVDKIAKTLQKTHASVSLSFSNSYKTLTKNESFDIPIKTLSHKNQHKDLGISKL